MKPCVNHFLKKLSAGALALSMLMSAAAMAESPLTVWEDAESKFYPDYGTQAEMRQAASELNIQIAEEGMVLLKNENGALPLGADERNISMFGFRSYNLQTGGGGSGAGRPGTYGIPKATLQQSLEAEGFKFNQRLAAAYDGAANEIHPDDFTKSMLNSYVSYQDAAIITLTRSGSEGSDEKMHDVAGNADTSKHYLEMTDAEIELVKHVKANFPKVIVLINSANIMEVGELNDPKTADNLGVDAILWVGHTGNDGAMAVGRILSGTVNPSGHTVDIWERDFTQGPTYTNIGAMSQNFNEDATRMNNNLYVNGEIARDSLGQTYHSVEYREGIYMGYRYYETAYDIAAEGEKEAAYANVVYPFGYGLSYTTFEWKMADDVALTDAITAPGQEIAIRVAVTNTGDVAGKDVVQIYVNPPYTEEGIEKATANLVGFGKTKLLQPGETEIVEVKFVAQDMASFDWNDANCNDFQGYELEAGAYEISARYDSHTPAFTVERTVAEGILCETDYITGNKIEAVFSQQSGPFERYYSVNDPLLENSISRMDLRQPDPSTIEDRTVDVDYIQFLTDEREYFSFQDSEEDLWYVSEVPETWTQAAGVAVDGKYAIQLKDLIGVRYNEAKIVDGVVVPAEDEGSKAWDEFMNQLTWEELVSLICAGDYGQGIAIPTIGKEVVFGGDGPTQFAWNSNLFFGSKGIQQFDVIGTNWVVAPIVAATYNTELAAEQGRMVGNESLFGGINEWYGPGCNTHRSPFSGRNFEYYSEDGVLAGKMVAALTKGTASKGVMIRIKHMFLNDQETNRNTSGGVLTWANEQAIREIYLKPYEIAVKEGDVTGGMTAFNRIGDAVCSTDYALLEAIFRDEWNFRGTFVTDCQDYEEYRYLNLMARTGQELPLGQTINMYNGQKIFDARFGIGYASAVEGTWDAEQNCVLVATNLEDARACEELRKNCGDMYLFFHDEALVAQLAELETEPSPTHYYAVRKSAQRVLYDYVNSNNMKNGLNRDIAAQEVTVTVNNTSTSVAIVLDAAAIGTTDIQVVGATGLPEGLTISRAGVISGGATTVGEYEVVLNLLLDNWVKTTANVKVIVAEAQ